MELERKLNKRKGLKPTNSLFGTTIAYDLQAGCYSLVASKRPTYNKKWCEQITSAIIKCFPNPKSLLEVGVGEATTLSGVQSILKICESSTFGFDISWSRIRAAYKWQEKNNNRAQLFVGDLFHIPLSNDSIDVVYSCHSLEPNKGKEQAAIAECLRVARYAVVLVEPIYELANKKAKKRMEKHGYVRGLRHAAENLGANISEYCLLPLTENNLNPSGLLSLVKKKSNLFCASKEKSTNWQCPLTGAPMKNLKSYFFAESVGVAYPNLKKVPLLRREYAVIASKIHNF